MRFRQSGAPSDPTKPSQDSTNTLSARELEVLQLITKGFTYDEIAKLMHVSRNTVMTFVRRIYSKLEVKSKIEAIHEARSQGLLRA
jgi:DNA-binding NarL/FixJ family response regulator